MENKNFIQKVCTFVAGVFRGAGAPESEKRVIAFLFSISLIVLMFLAVHYEIKTLEVVTLVAWFMFLSIWVLLGLATAQDITSFIKSKIGSSDQKTE